jgi:hypothetical protein
MFNSTGWISTFYLSPYFWFAVGKGSIAGEALPPKPGKKVQEKKG